MACYPSQALGGRAGICSSCYASQSCTTCSDANSPQACSAYCNTGCNTVCVAIQNFCSIGIESVYDHSDVGNQTFPCLAENEIIIKQWTAIWWNSYLDRLDSIYNIPGNNSGEGAKQPNPGINRVRAVASPPPQTAAHPANSLITADKYNQIAGTLRNVNAAVDDVAQNDVIKHEIAEALQSGWENATWNSEVCDICNAAANQNANNCNCSCNCTCPCSCPCLCPCSCPCYYGP